MKLQIASRIAIYAILDLAAQPDRQLSAAEIGKKYGISTHHLAKVLHALGRTGLVRSVRGAGGGYQFTGNPNRTTLADIIALFEPVGPPEGEADEPGEDTEAGAALRRLLGEIDEIALATLRSVTIATMLKLMRREHGATAPAPDGLAAAG